MALWNGNKAFRDDYESRIAQSLDMRQLSKDDRMRNFNEKPLVPVERPVPSETEVVKTSAKQIPKEEVAPSEPKVAKAKSAKNHKEGNKKTESTTEKIDREYEPEASPPVDKVQKDSRPEIDEKKLKELKREEEIAKRNQAEERKRKLAEKAAAKAAMKAQKEAEKKLKEMIVFLLVSCFFNRFSLVLWNLKSFSSQFIQEREKRARKKGGATVADLDTEEPTETVPEATEAEDIVETPVPQKNKHRKEHAVRQRARPRGPDSLPKALLKRKKATNYWVWGASAALVVIVLVVVGYSYLS